MSQLQRLGYLKRGSVLGSALAIHQAAYELRAVKVDCDVPERACHAVPIFEMFTEEARFTSTQPNCIQWENKV